jgi:excinuclease ABC subunit A
MACSTWTGDRRSGAHRPRPSTATYTGALHHLHDLFAQLPSRRRAVAGRYSFNVKGGRCETCQGDGIIRIEMLPADVYVQCEACEGRRYNRETLEIATARASPTCWT